jgi:hypothetical protein
MAAGPTPLETDFSPSTSHAFEPELTGPPPRPIPDALDRGPYMRRRRAAVIALALSGAVCLALSRAPGIDVLARYLLPLGYLHWIGMGALVLAAGLYVPLALHQGPFRYVRDGVPLPVRVTELVKAPTAVMNGVPSAHAFIAFIAFRHPETAELLHAEVRSNDFASSRKDAYEAPFKVGDTVTAVYLPGQLEKTLRLYAFLELSPDVNLTRRSQSQDSPWKLAVLLVAVPAIFVALFANVYAFGRYQPLEMDYRRLALPMVVGGLLIGGGMLAGLYLSHRAEQRRLRQRALTALSAGTAVETGTPFLGSGVYGWAMRAGVAAGAPLLGAVTTLCWCLMANAWLDRSAARPAPATVTDMVMKTHAFVFRQYELEYVLDGSAEKHTMMTAPEHLASFTSPAAVAHVRDGRFGWRWVENVTPAPPPDPR